MPCARLSIDSRSKTSSSNRVGLRSPTRAPMRLVEERSVTLPRAVGSRTPNRGCGNSRSAASNRIGSSTPSTPANSRPFEGRTASRHQRRPAAELPNGFAQSFFPTSPSATFSARSAWRHTVFVGARLAAAAWTCHGSRQVPEFLVRRMSSCVHGSFVSAVSACAPTRARKAASLRSRRDRSRLPSRAWTARTRFRPQHQHRCRWRHPSFRP
jgi:hypothetical protein